MPTLISTKSVVTPSEGAGPACVHSYSELFISLNYHFFALHFPFCSFACFLLLLCGTEVWVMHLSFFHSRSQLFFLTCFSSLSAFPLAPKLLFSSISYLPRTDLNKSTGKKWEWDFWLQNEKQVLCWHCISMPYVLQKATFTWSESAYIWRQGESWLQLCVPPRSSSQNQTHAKCSCDSLKLSPSTRVFNTERHMASEMGNHTFQSPKLSNWVSFSAMFL